MKTIKILMASFFAICLGVAVSAFTGSEKVQPVVLEYHWYEFVGDETDPDQVKDESLYQYRETEPECEDGEVICSVRAEGPTGTNANPNNFPPGLEGEITTAFNGGFVSSNIKMKAE